MSRTGNYHGTPAWQKKMEIFKVRNTLKDLSYKLKLKALQLKFAKPFQVVPLSFEFVHLSMQIKMSIIQLKTIEAQPMFPKGGIEVGNYKPEITH